MRIVFVRASNKIEVTYWKLIIELLDNNCEIYWISRPLLKEQLIIKESELEKVHLIEITSFNKLEFMIKSIPIIHKISQYSNIIIGTGYSGALPCIFSFPHCPTIVHLHDPWYIENITNPSPILRILIGFGRILEFLILKKATHLLLTSISHKKFIQKRQKFLSNNQITIIRNTVNPSRISFTKDPKLIADLKLQDKFVIVYSGQVIKTYGFHTLIKAFETISKKFPQIHVLIIGVYPKLAYKQQLQKYISLKKLNSNITLLKTIPYSEVPRYLTLGDIAIIPWDYSPVTNIAAPNKLFEYMACGLPIIASVLDGLTEIIQHQKNGFIFYPNDVNSLITTLEEAISESDLQKMGQFNRKLIETKYNLKMYIRKLLVLFQILREIGKKRKKDC